jgi:hypothetical protein
VQEELMGKKERHSETMVSRVFANVLDKMNFTQTKKRPEGRDALENIKIKQKRRRSKEPLSLDFSSVPKRRSRRNYSKSTVSQQYEGRNSGNITAKVAPISPYQEEKAEEAPKSLLGKLGKFIIDLF